MKALHLVLFLSVVNYIEGYRILGVFPHPGGSHFRSFQPLLLGLAEKGHDVTVISHFPNEKAPPTYKDISIKNENNTWTIDFKLENFDMNRWLKHLVSARNLFAIGYMNCKIMLENEQVKNIQKGDYDVVLIEQFNSDCGLGLAYKLEVPFIGITSHAVMSWTMGRVAALENPSHVPSHYLDFGKYPDFIGVLESIFVESWYKWAYYIFSQIPERWLMTYYFGNDLPALKDIARNMSLLLVSTYFPLTGTVPVAPNFVEIGGMHLIKENYIPDDTLEFLDKSNNGVIVFSMGSMIQASSWPPEKLEVFQKVLSERPENVLWKWENETMENLPPNVRLEKWIAQFDILHHKNVRAFITHAGMLGMTEAAHCGVPVISIPIYGDQFFNAACAKDSGLGVVLDYSNINEDDVRNALNTVLQPSFYKQAKAFGELFRDRPQKPLDTAIYWVEHVARHGGKHLRPLNADLPLYRYLLLDVILFISVCSSIILFILYKCCYPRRKNNKNKTE